MSQGDYANVGVDGGTLVRVRVPAHDGYARYTTNLDPIARVHSALSVHGVSEFGQSLSEGVQYGVDGGKFWTRDLNQDAEFELVSESVAADPEAIAGDEVPPPVVGEPFGTQALPPPEAQPLPPVEGSVDRQDPDPGEDVTDLEARLAALEDSDAADLPVVDAYRGPAAVSRPPTKTGSMNLLLWGGILLAGLAFLGRGKKRRR